jgi:cobalt-zinc-cadmium efflux system outer membrane protein
MYSYILVALLAANPMTLDQIDIEVQAHNPDIQSVSAQKRIAEAHLSNAMKWDDPQFSYRGWGAPLLQPWNVNQTQHMFMFTENIPSRSKRELQYLIASDDTEIQAMAIESKKREVIALAHQAFNQLIRTYDQRRIYHDEVLVAQQSIEATRIQYKAGKAMQSDVLKAGIAYSRLAEREIQYNQTADSARAQLNTLMGRPPDQPLEVEGSYVILEALPTQAMLQDLAVANRPDLLQLDLMAKQATRKRDLARKGLSPDYSVTAGYMLMPSGSEHRNGWIGEFSMTLPWLNRERHDSEIQQAQAEHDAILAEYQKQIAAIHRDIRESLIRAQAALKIVELYRDTLRPDAANVSKAATVAYQSEQSSLLNVLDTQNLSIDVEFALFDALANYEQSIADLERAIGVSVPGERKPL